MTIIYKTFEEVYFRRRKLNLTRLLNYGFQKGSKGFQYEISVMQGRFLAHVFINSDGIVPTQMIDSETGEE